MSNKCKEGNKSRLEAALEGVEMIFNEVLKGFDLVSLIAFDDKIRTIVTNKRKSQVFVL